MDSRILKAVAVAVAVGLVPIAAIVLMPRTAVNRVLHGPTNDTLELIGRAAEFNAALMTGKSDKLYRLFNSNFRAEIPGGVFDSALKAWRAGRVAARIASTHIEVQGMSGLVSTNVYWKGNAEPESPGRGDYDFLFQTWLRAREGWQLMWVSHILDPIAMDYGRQDSSSLREILQLALGEIITDEGIEKTMGLTNPSPVLVLVSRGIPPFDVVLPDKKVVWLRRDSIAQYQKPLGIAYFVEIMPLRVLGDIAIGTFDIVPVSGENRAVDKHVRSIKLFFRRTAGKWDFANYGSRW